MTRAACNDGAAGPQATHVAGAAGTEECAKAELPQLRLDLSYLTSHEVLDLQQGPAEFDALARQVRARRAGAYPEEWFEIVRARRDALATAAGEDGALGPFELWAPFFSPSGRWAPTSTGLPSRASSC